MRMIRTLLVAAAISTAASPSYAQSGPDYIFNVPVRIENAQPLAGNPLQVMCTVSAYDASWRHLGSQTATQTITPSETGYRSSVRLELTLPPGLARSNVRRWSCGLLLQTANTPSGVRVAIPGVNSEARLAQYPTVTGQSVASSALSTNGEFPS
jgi:hypothetical protein